MRHINPYYKRIFLVNLCSIGLFGLLLVGFSAHAESGAAALGKLLDESYVKAKRMGRGVTVDQIQAATRESSARTNELIQRDKKALLQRFLKHNRLLARRLTPTTKDGSPVAQDNSGTKRDLLASPKPAEAKTSSPKPAGLSSAGSTGAKNVRFTKDAPPNPHPNVNEDGIVTDR